MQISLIIAVEKAGHEKTCSEFISEVVKDMESKRQFSTIGMVQT